jgi:hypothetical protein
VALRALVVAGYLGSLDHAKSADLLRWCTFVQPGSLPCAQNVGR